MQLLWWVCLFCRFFYIGSKSTTKKNPYIWSEKRKRSVKCVLWSLSIKISVRTRRLIGTLMETVVKCSKLYCLKNCRQLFVSCQILRQFWIFFVLNGQYFSVVSILQYFFIHFLFAGVEISHGHQQSMFFNW